MFLVSRLPDFDQLYEALPDNRPLVICKYLGVSPQTLRRWRAAHDAPRIAKLAMYWESPWGAALVASTAQNGEMYAKQHAAGLLRENAALRVRIDRLESLGDFGSANQPLLLKAS